MTLAPALPCRHVQARPLAPRPHSRRMKNGNRSTAENCARDLRTHRRPEGRTGEDRRCRSGLRRGRADHRRVPAHGARPRVRRLRDGAHHLHDRARARRAVHRAAGVPDAALPSRRLRLSARFRHPHPQGPGRQEGRRARLFGHHRRVDARHLRQRIRARLVQGHLGGRRRGARDQPEAAAERDPRAGGEIARRHDGERRDLRRLHRPGRDRPRRAADRRLGAGWAEAGRNLSGADRERGAGGGGLVQAHRHLSDPRLGGGQDRGAGKASPCGKIAVRRLRRRQADLHGQAARAARATVPTTASTAG